MLGGLGQAFELCGNLFGANAIGFLLLVPLAPVFREARIHVGQDFFADGLHHAIEVLARILLHLAGAGGANVVNLGDGLADGIHQMRVDGAVHRLFRGLL